jgi:hypothetical protein
MEVVSFMLYLLYPLGPRTGLGMVAKKKIIALPRI